MSRFRCRARTVALLAVWYVCVQWRNLHAWPQPSNKEFGSFAKSFLDKPLRRLSRVRRNRKVISRSMTWGPVDELNASVWREYLVTSHLEGDATARTLEQPQVVTERLQFSDWIVGELTRVMRDKGGFRDHLDPDKGNFVDHELLFGPLPDGIQLEPTSSPARIWRVTPQEHITRLNELINIEPRVRPSRSQGLRTHGDVVPTNHGGELKLYFGTDQIIQWQGGTVAYATAVKSVPAVLSSARDHGLEKLSGLLHRQQRRSDTNHQCCQRHHPLYGGWPTQYRPALSDYRRS